MRLHTRRILLLLAAAFACSGATLVIHGPVVHPSAGGPSFLINQNFEGTGYDNSESWTEAGVVDEDNTTTPGRGSQSCTITTDSVGSTTFTFGAAQSEIWGHFLFRSPDVTPGSELSITHMVGVGGVQQSQIRIRTTGAVRAVHNGINVNGTAGDLADNTWVRIWWHWKAETSEGAADGVFQIWTSTQAETNRADATLVVNQSNGTGEAAIETFAIRGTPANSISIDFDQVIVDDAEFTTVDA